MPTFNEQLADKTTERSLVVARAGAGSAKKIVKMMQEMERDIVSRLPEINGEMTRARLLKQLKIIRGVIAGYYGEIATVSESDLAEIAKIEGRWQVYTINNIAGVEIASVLPPMSVFEELAKETLIVGNIASDWWAQQSEKLQNDFQRVVQLGLSQAETNQQITKRFKDVSGLAQRNAYALVKTATQSVAIKSRDKSMQANADLIRAKVSMATLDSHTSILCASYDKAEYNLQNEPINGNKKPYLEIPRHFNCLTGDTLVSSVCNITGISKRWFDGYVFVISTSCGNKFTCTPNHPVLTDRGWVGGSMLNVGDKVFDASNGERVRLIDSNDKNVEACIHDVFESFVSSGKMLSVPVPLTSKNLHGDASDGEVAIVLTNRLLRDEVNASLLKMIFYKILILGNISVSYFLIGFSHLCFFFKRYLSSFCGNIGVFCKRFYLLNRVAVHSRLLLLRSVSLFDSICSKYFFNCCGSKAESFPDSSNANTAIKKVKNLVKRWSNFFVSWYVNSGFNKKFTNFIMPMSDNGANLLDTHAGIIKADYIISVDRVIYSGHVYNLETVEGWYCANGIVTHNCRSYWSYALKSFAEITGLAIDDFKPSTRASMDGQIPAATTFEQFLSNKSEAWQDKYLGKGKAQLWRDGRITLSDMVSGTGRELTLDQLAKFD